jgi:hypothetical protein
VQHGCSKFLTLAGMLVGLALPAQAHATYTATYSGQCCYLTLEAGDSATTWFEFRNTGDQRWTHDAGQEVILGTERPESPFRVDGDWLAPNRPTALDQGVVEPGQVGRFTFKIRAPQAPGAYREHFAPLIENVTWLAPGTCCYLDHTVIAAQAPAVKITSAPLRVQRGSDVAIAADATDNLAVDRVVFSLEASTVTARRPVAGPSGYRGTLPTTDLGAGVHSIVVRAQDRGGRVSVSTSQIEVFDPAPTPPPPVPPAPPQLAAPPVKLIAVPRFLPRFGTRGRRGGGSIIGSLASVGGFQGATHGSRVRISCVRACTGGTTFTVRTRGRRRTSIRLRRAIRLTRRSIVEIRVVSAGRLGRFGRFNFRRRAGIVLAHRISSGCVAATPPHGRTSCR